MAGRYSGRSKDARRVMQWYGEFLPKRPWSFGLFVGLQKVPRPTRSPRRFGARRSAPWSPATAGRWRKRKRRSSRFARSFRRQSLTGWGPCRSRPCRACSIRCCPRACSGTGRVTLSENFPTSHRRASGARRQGAERTLADASVSDRRRGPPRRAERDGLELPGRDVVHGHRGHRSGPGQGGGAHGVGQGILASPASVLSWAAPT